MKREGILQALWVIGFLVNGFVLLVLLKNLEFERLFSNPVMTPQKDLPLGSEIPTTLRPYLVSQKPLLVVAFGKCSECTLKNLSVWVLMLERWSDEVAGVIVAAEKESVLKELTEREGWKIPFVSDERGELLKELNAYFLPRTYGFSPDGKLVWKQESLSVTQLEAIRFVVESAKGKEYARKVFDRKPKWAEGMEKASKFQGR